jgi:hypothetical protein
MDDMVSETLCHRNKFVISGTGGTAPVVCWESMLRNVRAWLGSRLTR